MTAPTEVDWLADDGTTTPAEIDWSAVFDALAHTDRRTVLAHLRRESSRPVPIEELAAAARDGPDDVDDATIRLRHVHLPKLTQATLVETVDEAGRVSPTPLALAIPDWLLTPERDADLPSAAAGATGHHTSGVDADDD